MNHSLRIICNSCRHSSVVSDAVVDKILPDVKNPSNDSIRKNLLLNKPKLVCSNCGAHSCEIEYTTPIGKRTDKPVEARVPDGQKRYIDEGIGGTRETLGNRWLRLEK